jgi:hypothetical protein
MISVPTSSATTSSRTDPSSPCQNRAWSRTKRLSTRSASRPRRRVDKPSFFAQCRGSSSSSALTMISSLGWVHICPQARQLNHRIVPTASPPSRSLLPQLLQNCCGGGRRACRGAEGFGESIRRSDYAGNCRLNDVLFGTAEPDPATMNERRAHYLARRSPRRCRWRSFSVKRRAGVERAPTTILVHDALSDHL